jgi:spore coat polysaccharide biosynthesis predicted glycosyltransferase SpsG
MKFLFFVESGPSIGLGHIKRSLLLAHELNNLGAEVTFAADALDKTGRQLVFAAELSLEDADSPKMLTREFIFVDGYNFVIQEIKASYPNSKIIVLEDYCHREFSADMVVDANFLFRGHTLRNCGIDSKNWLEGKEFVIVDKKYCSVKAKKTSHRDNKRILLSLGSGDVDSLSIKIFDCLARSKMDDLLIDLLPGPYFPEKNLEIILRDYSAVFGTVLPPTQDLSRVYEQYDFAIGSAGTSSYERLAAGIFSLNIIGNANQQRVSLALAEQGLALSFDAMHGFSYPELSEKIALLTEKGSFHPALAEVPDGRGQLRIASELLRLTAG